MENYFKSSVHNLLHLVIGDFVKFSRVTKVTKKKTKKTPNLKKKSKLH